MAPALAGYGTQGLYHAIRHAPWEREDAGSLHTLQAEVIEVDKVGKGETVYLVRAEMLDARAVRIRLLLKTDAADPPLKSGTRITASVGITDHGNEYLYSRGIAGNAEAIGSPECIPGEGRSIASLLSFLRSTLSERIRKGLGGDDAGFYSALLLDERDALSDKAALAFRRSGTTHLLALSGMHLTVLALLLLRLLALLRTPPPLRFGILLLFLLLYAALTGFPLSLLRASLMMAIYELGRLLRLLSDAVTALFFSVALILLFSPGAALDVGLCLSFLATLGILVVLEVYPNPVSPKRRARRLLYALVFSVLSGLFAILFTALLTTAVFGHLSLIALPANLLLSPLVNAALVIGPFLLLFPSLFGPIAKHLSSLILGGVQLAGGIPGGYTVARYPLFTAALLLFTLYLAGLLLRSLPSHRAFLLRFLAATAALSAVFLGCHIPHQAAEFVLIVREGTSDYIVLREDRHTTVIVNGCEGAHASLLSHLEGQGISEIDTLILTHTAEGDSRMLTAVARKMLVHSIILPVGQEATNEDNALAYLARELGMSVLLTDSNSLSVNGLTVKLLSIGDTPHNGLFLSVEGRGARIAYASPSALAAVNAEARHAFIEDASLLYLAAHPAPAYREGPLLLPSGCRLLSAYPELLPEEFAKEAEEITPYGVFYMPLS